MAGNQAVYKVSVDGRDVTSRLHPYLEKLTIHDAAGTHSDSCNVTLDDRDGQIALPREGALLEASLGWGDPGLTVVFVGKVDDIQSRGARGSGMQLQISAKALDTKGKAKQPQEKHWDNEKLGKVLAEAGELAGVGDVRVDPALASITRPWWGMTAESFAHFGHRLAREVGGTFKMAGDRAILVKRNGGTSASGLVLPEVSAVRGEGGNIINWNISPLLGRPRFKTVRARWYDRKEAKWKERDVDVGDDDAEATHTDRFTRADETEAEGSAKSGAEDAKRNKGEGSVEIDGEPAAQPEGTCLVSGCRPGVDGLYRIDAVDHEFSRSSGFTTKLTLKQPQGSAGKDGRRSRDPLDKELDSIIGQ